MGKRSSSALSAPAVLSVFTLSSSAPPRLRVEAFHGPGSKRFSRNEISSPLRVCQSFLGQFLAQWALFGPVHP